MLRVMIDTHIFDRIHGDAQLKERLKRLIIEDRLRIVMTHAQVDEIQAIPDDRAEYRNQLLSLLDELTMERRPTKGALFDISRFDEATIDDSGDIDDLRESDLSVNPSMDALIFNSATLEGIDFLVSNDKDRTRVAKRVKRGLIAKTFDELRDIVMRL